MPTRNAKKAPTWKKKTHPMVIPFHGISWAQKHIYPYIWPWIDGHTKNMAIWLYGYMAIYIYVCIHLYIYICSILIHLALYIYIYHIYHIWMDVLNPSNLQPRHNRWSLRGWAAASPADRSVLGHPIEPLLRSECIASLRGEEHDGYIMLMIYM